MLQVQKFLSQHSLDTLREMFGIKTTVSDDLVILNYDQIGSPEKHPIVCECRGLTLSLKDWSLVARSFRRFFHYDQTPNFSWENAVCQSKEDGSLILCYWHNGELRINSRGSFGNGTVGNFPITWRELFLQTVSEDRLRNTVKPGQTYVFELCSPLNKVVRHYPVATSHLLTVFEGYDEVHDITWVNERAEEICCQRPILYNASNYGDIQKMMELESDPTFEGFVVRSTDLKRIKIKNPPYVGLHHLRGGMLDKEGLVDLILNKELDEVVNYFPSGYLEKTKDKFWRLSEEMHRLWGENKGLEIQKDFAMKVKDFPLASILFRARKTGEHPGEIWKKSSKILSNLLDEFQPVRIQQGCSLEE